MGRGLRGLLGIFGPIFAKELRVAARRKRNYWMRGAYLALLTLVVCIAWVSLSWTFQRSSAAGAMGMGLLAPTLLITCGWFQLFGLTLIAPILTSGTISEERTHRTLGVLLMTPITPFQIVAGKFLSRSLQLLLLVGLTLPVLATVQVFGGLETKAVLAVLGLCLSAGLFAGALGLLISTYSNRVYVTILNSYFLMLGLYLVVPIGLGWLASEYAQNTPGPGTSVHWLIGLMTALNPFITLWAVSMETMSPGMAARIGFGGWGGWISLPCIAVLLAATAILTWLATLRVRGMTRGRPRRRRRFTRWRGWLALPFTVILRFLATLRVRGWSRRRRHEETTGPQPEADSATVPTLVEPLEAALNAPAEAVPDGAASELTSQVLVGEGPAGLTRRLAEAPANRETPPVPRTPVAEVRTRAVGDNPVLWREMSQRIAGTSRWWWVGLVLLLLSLALVYSLVIVNDGLDDGATHATILPIFLLLLLLEAGVFAAPTITSEKEASSWPILLSTTLKAHQILWSKAAGVARRLIPISLLLIGHVLIFTIAGYLHPICLLHTALIVGGFVSFLIAVGIWFSLRLERTTSAVVATVLVGLFLWALVPLMAAFLGQAFDVGKDAAGLTITIHPFFWMGAAGAGAVDVLKPSSNAYWIPGSDGNVGPGAFTAALLAVCGVFFLVAVGILASCSRRFNQMVGRPS